MDRKGQNFKQYLLLLSLLLSILSCHSEESRSELKKYIEKVKARPIQAIDPIPKLRHYSLYKYPKSLQKDPFKKPINEEKEGTKPDVKRVKQPLEFYALTELKMVGTFQEKNYRFALIKAPTGRIYKVKAGDYIGQQDGLIELIEYRKIHIKELLPVPGGWESRANFLNLIN